MNFYFFLAYNYKVKIIVVEPLKRLSLQKHKLRHEYWYILEGNGLLTLNNKKTKLNSHAIINIKKGDVHRIENLNKSKKLVILEVQKGVCKEEDIVRIEDDFNRVK